MPLTTRRDPPRPTDRSIAAEASWSRQYVRRRSIARRFGEVFRLPLAKRGRDVLLRTLADGAQVLEIGAGDRRLRPAIEKRGGRYASMDIDPEGRHDYASLEAIDRRFDLVFAFEVVEHIPPDVLPGWLEQVAGLIQPGGRLIVSTPNIYYPPAYLRDVTHRTPLCYDELGALVEGAGLEVERIVRVYNDPFARIVLRRFAFGWLFRLLGIDYARQIVLCARREERG